MQNGPCRKERVWVIPALLRVFCKHPLQHALSSTEITYALPALQGLSVCALGKTMELIAFFVLVNYHMQSDICKKEGCG